MKLTRKLVFGIVLGILLVHAVSAVVRVRRETALLDTDVASEERILGHALALAVERVWVESGEDAALSFLAHANARESHVDIRWLPLDDLRVPGLAPELLVALETTKPGAVLVHAPDSIRTFTVVDLPEGRRGAIEIIDWSADEDDYVLGSIKNAAVAAIALIALCALVAWLVGRHLIGRPIRELVQQARRIGRGDLEARVALKQNDELGELSAEMNRMADNLAQARREAAEELSGRLAAVAQLRHADRLTTVGTLAAGIAHELGTPLNVIRGYAQLTLENPALAAAHEGSQIIVEQTSRITGIIRQLLDFARRSEAGSTAEVPPECDATEVTRQTISMLEALTRKSGTRVELNAEGALPTAMLHGELQQVLSNLVVNAVQAAPEGGRLEVDLDAASLTRPGDDEPRDYVRLRVRDDGGGIPSEVVDRIFEPFFTTKEVGQGTGLGLAVAWGIVHDRGGWIEVESEPQLGTCFSVMIPAGKRAAS